MILVLEDGELEKLVVEYGFNVITRIISEAGHDRRSGSDGRKYANSCLCRAEDGNGTAGHLQFQSDIV